MSVFKKYRGKRITSKDKNWSKGTWWCYKRLGGGRPPIHKSLKGAQTKEDAEHAERELIREAFDKRYGRGSKETFAGFVERVYRKYVAAFNVNLGAKAIYIRLLCSDFGSRALVDITAQDCRNAQTGFRKKYSASTVNLIMSTASKIFNLAGEEGILKENPMRYVKRVKEPPPRDRLLSKEEWERLWRELEKDNLLLRFINLAVNLPLRRGQLLAITPDAVNLADGFLYATSSKNRVARFVPLNTTASSTLKIMIQEGELPFPLKETGLRKRWVKVLKRAKIENFRFHDLRREFASSLIRQNVNPNVVQKLFAHSDMKITNVYMHSNLDELKAAVETLDEKLIDGGVQ